MRIMRKLLLAVLCVTVLLACAVTANAEETGSCGPNVSWTLDDNGLLTISGSGKMTDYSMESPAPWYAKNGTVHNVVIESGVTDIGSYAFLDCFNMRSVEIPEGVERIGANAFEGCRALLYAKLPESLKIIERSAFSSCSKMEINGLPEGLTVLGGSAFRYCRAITEITIPAGITALESRVFNNCSALKSVTFLANTYTEIGSSAFQGCTSLRLVDIPDGLEMIDEYSFSGCTSLAVVKIPASVTTVDMYAFTGSSNIHHIIFPGTKEQWMAINGNNHMYMPNHETRHVQTTMDVIKVTANCTEETVSCTLCDKVIRTVPLSGEHFFEDGVCADCGYVLPWEYEINQYTETVSITAYTGTETVVEIPSSINGVPVTHIEYAFRDNSVIKELTIPASVIAIAEWAGSFENCSSLEKITVAEDNPNFSSDDTGVLYNKDKTRLLLVPDAISGTFMIPDSVQSVEYLALANCTGLTGVGIGSNVTELAYASFMNCTGLTWMGIPASVTYIDSSAFDYCTGMEYYYVDEANTVYSSWDGVLIYYDEVMAAPQQYYGSWTVPEYVYRIGVNAFYNCTGLTEITIPERVNRIGGSAFFNCDALTQISVPDSVTYMGSGVFEDCDGLTSVRLSNSIDFIPWNTFADCDLLNQVVFGGAVKAIEGFAFKNCDSLQTIKIPEGVTQIETSAFYECDALKTVYLPVSVTRIGWMAFCGSPVTDVYYAGTQEQWKQIDMMNMEYVEFENATIHYNYGGEVRGDLDGDGSVTDADAMYLLRHTLFGSGRYPMDQSGDVNGDGSITDADAMYLLRYTLFGSTRYPLH